MNVGGARRTQGGRNGEGGRVDERDKKRPDGHTKSAIPLFLALKGGSASFTQIMG